MSQQRLRNTILTTDVSNLRRFYLLDTPARELVGANSVTAQGGVLPGHSGAPSHSWPNFPASYHDGVDDHFLADSEADIDDMSAVSVVAYMRCISTSGALGHGQHIANKGWSISLVDDTGNGNSTNEIQFVVDRTSDLRRRTAIGDAGYTTNRWVVLGMTWDGTLASANIAIYLDGQAITSSSAATQNGSGDRVSDAGDTLRLGCNDGAGCLHGYLAWAAVWESELSAQKVRQIYDASRAFVD